MNKLAQRSKLILAAGLTVATTLSAWAGDLQGKLSLKSELAKRRIGQQKTTPPDDSPGYRGDVPSPSESELENVVVFVSSTDLPVALKCTPQLRKTADNIMFQRNKEFIPHVLPISKGSKVYFENQDTFMHHVYSESKPGDFSIEKHTTGVRSVDFDSSAPVEVFCGIHPRMNSYVLVVPNDYFSRVNAQGRFRIRNLPPGKYQIKIWHPRLSKSIVREVEMTASSKTENLDI